MERIAYEVIVYTANGPQTYHYDTIRDLVKGICQWKTLSMDIIEIKETITVTETLLAKVD